MFTSKEGSTSGKGCNTIDYKVDCTIPSKFNGIRTDGDNDVYRSVNNRVILTSKPMFELTAASGLIRLMTYINANLVSTMSIVLQSGGQRATCVVDMQYIEMRKNRFKRICCA